MRRSSVALYLRLFNQIILRDLKRNPLRTALTLLGIALGVSVVVAVQLANDRAISSFSSGLRVLSGRAHLQITANGRPLDETLIGELSWVWDVGAMTALIDGRIETAGGNPRPFDGEAVRLLGVDLLSDGPFRSYTVADDDVPADNLALAVTRDEFIDLIVDPRAIVLPGRLAEEWSVGPGDVVNLLVGNREGEFFVHSILADEGVAQAFDGRIVFMDIAAAQMALDRLGEIDRIEIVLEDPSAAAAVANRIQQQLPNSVIVFRPEDAEESARRMTRAFRYNLTALSYIALVVGMILIYNTLHISVVRRRGEIGSLRTLGASRTLIGGMFLAEAIALGVIGAIAGIWIGEGLARGAGALVSRTIAMLYTGVGSQGSGGLDLAFYLQTVTLGALLAAVSGTGPALRATAVSPIDTVRKGRGGSLKTGRWTLAGVASLVPALLLSFAPPIGGFPFLGYAAGVLFIAAFGLLSPLFVRAMIHDAGPVLERVFPVEGRLATETIRSNLSRVVVAVISLSIAVAMLASVAIMVASFRDTVVVWVEQTLRGDLYLRPAASGGDGGRNTMAQEVLDALDLVPGIAALDRFRGVEIDYAGYPAVMASGEFRTMAAYSRLIFLGGGSTVEVAEQLIGEDRVIVSEPFAVRHGVSEGDIVELPTPEGSWPFEVTAVFYDYSDEGGLIVMDRGTWVSRLQDSEVSNVAVYLVPGADAEEVRRAIAGRLEGVRARIATNGELREQVFGVFDQTFQVTYALEAIALVVAVLGIATTLAALVIERRPEIAMLRFLGTSRAQIRRLILMESGLIGILGGAIGLALGGVLSLLLIYVINFQSFGWTIQFSLPLGFLAQSLAMVLVATVIAGLYPAALALRVDPIEGIRAE